MRISIKKTHIGAFIGLIVGSIVELLVGNSNYAPMIAETLSKGGMSAFILGAFYGGALIGGNIGLVFSGVVLGKNKSVVIKSLFAGSIAGALWGGFIWAFGGGRLIEDLGINFGRMGGPFIGIGAGVVVGFMLERKEFERSHIHAKYDHIKEDMTYEVIRLQSETNFNSLIEAHVIADSLNLVNKKKNYIEFKDMALFLIANYDPIQSCFIITKFDDELFPYSIGFVIIEQIILAIEHIDDFTFNDVFKSEQLIKYPELKDYFIKSNDRTSKAVDIITYSLLNFKDINGAKKVWSVLTVPEIKTRVKDKLFSIDEEIANYVTT